MSTHNSINDLSAAVTHTHGCKAIHVQTVEVHERHDGETVWDGTVHVFAIDHAKASRAYAWSYVVDEKTQRRRFLAILGVPPINSPIDAVRAAIASGEQT